MLIICSLNAHQPGFVSCVNDTDTSRARDGDVKERRWRYLSESLPGSLAESERESQPSPDMSTAVSWKLSVNLEKKRKTWLREREGREGKGERSGGAGQMVKDNWGTYVHWCCCSLGCPWRRQLTCVTQLDMLTKLERKEDKRYMSQVRRNLQQYILLCSSHTLFTNFIFLCREHDLVAILAWVFAGHYFQLGYMLSFARSPSLSFSGLGLVLALAVLTDTDT